MMMLLTSNYLRSRIRPTFGRVGVVWCGVDKKVRAYMPNQMWLMTSSVDEWVREDHLARSVSELVEAVFDLDRL